MRKYFITIKYLSQQLVYPLFYALRATAFLS